MRHFLLFPLLLFANFLKAQNYTPLEGPEAVWYVQMAHLDPAGAITLAQDDLVRLFLEWIEKYHEFHFAVIQEIYKNQELAEVVFGL